MFWLSLSYLATSQNHDRHCVCDWNSSFLSSSPKLNTEITSKATWQDRQVRKNEEGGKKWIIIWIFKSLCCFHNNSNKRTMAAMLGWHHIRRKSFFYCVSYFYCLQDRSGWRGRSSVCTRGDTETCFLSNLNWSVYIPTAFQLLSCFLEPYLSVPSKAFTHAVFTPCQRSPPKYWCLFDKYLFSQMILEFP